MKYVIFLCCLFLIACTKTVPVQREFPESPSALMKSCPDLLITPPTEKLSEVLIVVTNNYALYHECRIKVDSWIEWYNEQKKIFDNTK